MSKKFSGQVLIYHLINQTSIVNCTSPDLQMENDFRILCTLIEFELGVDMVRAKSQITFKASSCAGCMSFELGDAVAGMYGI